MGLESGKRRETGKMARRWRGRDFRLLVVDSLVLHRPSGVGLVCSVRRGGFEGSLRVGERKCGIGTGRGTWRRLGFKLAGELGVEVRHDMY